MTQAQLKSGSLIAELTPSLVKGELLISEMDVHRIIREAKKIPERYQGLSIEGLPELRLVNLMKASSSVKEPCF